MPASSEPPISRRAPRALDFAISVASFLALACSLLCVSLVHLRWPQAGFEASLVLLVYGFLAGVAFLFVGSGLCLWRAVRGHGLARVAAVVLMLSAVALAVAGWVPPMGNG